MTRAKSLYPSALATIKSKLEAPVGAAAQAYADKLRENVGSPSGGQGAKYPNLPNRSSAPGQYPVRQSGDLANSVTVRDTPDPMRKQAGFAGLPQARLEHTEFGRSGGRAPLQKTADDPDTRREMLEAAKAAGK